MEKKILSHNGKNMHCVSFLSNELTAKMSYDRVSKKSLDELREAVTTSTFEPKIAINGGLFVTNNTVPTYVGGISSNGVTLNEFAGDWKPTGSALCIAKYKGVKNIGIGMDIGANDFWRQGAFTLVYNYEGVETTYLDNLYKESAARTAIGISDDKGVYTVYIICSDIYNKLTGLELVQIFRDKLKCKYAIALDGGLSSCMYYQGMKPVQTTRKIADAIVFGVEKDPVDPPIPPLPEFGVHIKLTGSAARLRADVVNGTVKTIVPDGSIFEVVGLYSWNATDGCKWGWGKYANYEGYFQYDPNVMYPFGIVPSGQRYKMVLTGSTARIRGTVQGTVLTTVANGNSINIESFLANVASDGYRWCKGNYNGVSGYFQYDPAVMYPTND